MQVGPSSKVIKFLNENPNSRAKTVIDSTNLDAQTVYRALSYLHKTKRLSRRAGRYSVAYALPMTAITAEEKQPPVPKPALKDKALSSLLLKVRSLERELEEIRQESHDYAVKYFDAKAIIKYLEDRLKEKSNGNA